MGWSALLAPDEIPVGWVLTKPDLLPAPLADAARDPLRRSEVTGALYQAALLIPDVDDAARLHRLVQAVVLHHLPDQDRHELVAGAVALLAVLFPDEPWEPVAWPVCARLLPHAYALVDHAQGQRLATSAYAELLSGMGDYIWARGLGLTRARDLHQQALAVHQRLYEGDHPHIATTLTALAGDLRALGEPARARQLDEQALAMFQRLYEGDHEALATALASVAADLRRLGEPARARDLDEQALTMRERLHEGDHPATAYSLGALATDLCALGEPTRARQFQDQAQGMARRLFEGDNPRTALALNNFADDLCGLGDYARARQMNEQALGMFQRLYKGDHPRIALALHSLADDLRGLGDDAGARDLDEQALAMRQRLSAQEMPTS
jgi:tetratricopeptide (TPR) repeat protein